MEETTTPHNSAKVGKIANTCIICGDPQRSQYIAEHFLKNAKLINNVRGIQGYTGTYKGKRISVMAHGMGMPSISIYVYELINFYKVKNLIRIGTAGIIDDDVELGDIVIANKVSTTSNIIESFGFDQDEVFDANKYLLELTNEQSEKLNLKTQLGNILSYDIFYDSIKNLKKFRKEGITAVEMEVAALYALAKKYKCRAIALLAASDNLIEKESLTPEERIYEMDNIITLGLNVAINIKED